MDARDRLTMSEVTRRSGFAASALRFYEERGLISAGRTGGGRRTYQRSVLRRLAFIRAAGNVGRRFSHLYGCRGRRSAWHGGRCAKHSVAAVDRHP